MKAILTSSLGVTLGLLVAGGRADDVVWRAAKDRPPRTPPCPVGPAEPVASSVLASTPEETLGAPIPRPAPALVNATALSRILAGIERPPALKAADPAVIRASAGDIWIRVRAQKPGDDAPPALAVPVAADGVACPNCAIVYGPDATFAAAEGDGGRAPLFLVSAEYLLWYTRGANGPVLLTGSAPGSPARTTLLSYSDLDEQTRSGFRVGGALFLDRCASYGIDGRLFTTGERTGRYAIADAAGLDLFRPFVPGNAPLVLRNGAVVLPPPNEESVIQGDRTGSFAAANRSEFWGAEINYRDNLCCGCAGRLDLLAGFRYLSLDEDLTIVEDYTRRTRSQFFPDELAGTRVVITDRFSTRNDFYGGQIGAVAHLGHGRFALDLRGTVALGTTHQESQIDGGQVRSPLNGTPNTAFVAQGGLLALNSNIGTRSRDVFSVAPEVGVNLGYQVSDHLKAFVGYNFLYWSNVVRPGDQIDTVLDVNRIPRFLPPGVSFPPVSPPRPAANFNATDFWAQGLNAGIEYRW